MKLAIIPARGGSKRIPRKNIKLFNGKPIIAWSVQAAMDAGIFDRIIVSTDDPEIASVAIGYGAEVPFMRPAELSNDHVGTRPVVAHAIEWCRANGFDPLLVCCIYATAPFIQIEDILKGLSILEHSNAEFAVSVTSFPFPIQRAIKLRLDGRMEMFNPGNYHTRSQDLPDAYHDAGQFYWGRANAWLLEDEIFGQSSLPVVLPRYRVQDIDTPDDWELAEQMFEFLESNSPKQ